MNAKISFFLFFEINVLFWNLFHMTSFSLFDQTSLVVCLFIFLHFSMYSPLLQSCLLSINALCFPQLLKHFTGAFIVFTLPSCRSYVWYHEMISPAPIPSGPLWLLLWTVTMAALIMGFRPMMLPLLRCLTVSIKCQILNAFIH